MTVRQAVVAGWIGALLAAAPAGAQQWAQPKCDLKPGHYLVNSGVLYLKNASNTKFDEQRQKDLRDAERVLTQAVTTGGQEGNGAAWYYLGRRYVLLGDPVGADSTFRRAEQLAPQCASDIEAWRRFMWMPLYNKGVQAYQAGSSDSAIHYFKQASRIYPDATGFGAVASLFANAGETDSAAFYYGEVIRVAQGSDTTLQRQRREAMFNRGAVYNQAQRWKESEAAFRQYLEEVPGDAQALSGLAAAYAQTGRADSALAIYRMLLANAEQADPRHLFAAGVAMFNAAPEEPDSSAIWDRCRTARRPAGRATPAQTRQIATACHAEARDSMAAWRGPAMEYYRGAAGAFEAGLVHHAVNRDAMFNLVNTYYRLRDTVKMLGAAQKLYAVDPMNRNTVRLLATAWQLRGNIDSTLRYLEIAEEQLPAEVTVTSFAADDTRAMLTGLVTNIREKAAAPLALSFQFLDAKGDVVATRSAPVPALEGGASHHLEVRAEGSGIVAWRYRRE
jgi:tetratricopeptide (TPR) repeat protein